MSGKVLRQEQAAEIYAHKIAALQPGTFKASLLPAEVKLRGKSMQLAKWYGVSAKTIRDIWNRRSWVKATKHLWETEFNVSGAEQVRIRAYIA